MAIRSNLQAIRRAVAPAKVCAVVKADGYGHGALEVSRTLLDAGAERLAVFTPAQAIAIAAGTHEPRILILVPAREVPNDATMQEMLDAGRVEWTVVDAEQARSLAQSASPQVPLRVHIECDCGLGRGGASAATFAGLFAAVQSEAALQLVGIFTHFSAEDPAIVKRQAQQFDALLLSLGQSLPADTLIHAASSGPAFTVPAEARDMVRIGLGWTGALPSPLCDAAAVELNLRPALSWRSELAQVRCVEAGASIGYGSRVRTTRDTTIGIIPIGYSDGYPSTCADKDEPQQVIVGSSANQRSAQVLGAVSMDQITIELGPNATEKAGDEVILIDNAQASPASLHNIARRAGIVPHELISRLHARIPRSYLGASEGHAKLPVHELRDLNTDAEYADASS